MSRKKLLPRCSAVAKDNVQCGRRVKDGSQPPICHLHKPGATMGDPFVQTLTPLDILQKLMSDSDPAIRLRAVEAYLKNSEQGCAECASREAQTHTDLDVYTMRPAELEELDQLLQALDDFDARIRNTPRIANTRDQESTDEFRKHQEPPTREAAVSVEAALATAAEPRRRQRDADEVKAPYELPAVFYDEVGLFVLPETGEVTHPDGDETAQKILSGAIPFEDAKRMAEDASARATRIGAISNIRSF